MISWFLRWLRGLPAHVITGWNPRAASKHAVWYRDQRTPRTANAR